MPIQNPNGPRWWSISPLADECMLNNVYCGQWRPILVACRFHRYHWVASASEWLGSMELKRLQPLTCFMMICKAFIFYHVKSVAHVPLHYKEAVSVQWAKIKAGSKGLGARVIGS